jgi:hypothetical protein
MEGESGKGVLRVTGGHSVDRVGEPSQRNLHRQVRAHAPAHNVAPGHHLSALRRARHIKEVEAAEHSCPPRRRISSGLEISSRHSHISDRCGSLDGKAEALQRPWRRHGVPKDSLPCYDFLPELLRPGCSLPPPNHLFTGSKFSKQEQNDTWKHTRPHLPRKAAAFDSLLRSRGIGGQGMMKSISPICGAKNGAKALHLQPLDHNDLHNLAERLQKLVSRAPGDDIVSPIRCASSGTDVPSGVRADIESVSFRRSSSADAISGTQPAYEIAPSSTIVRSPSSYSSTHLCSM